VEDNRQALRGKYLLPRTKLARQYNRMAVEALHIIEVNCIMPQLEQDFDTFLHTGTCFHITIFAVSKWVAA
jgi:hypothetical protein